MKKKIIAAILVLCTAFSFTQAELNAFSLAELQAVASDDCEDKQNSDCKSSSGTIFMHKIKKSTEETEPTL